MRLAIIGVLIGFLVGNANAAEPAAPQYDHSQLLVSRDEASQEHPVKTPADWSRRRRDILTGMQLAMGKLPDVTRHLPLDVKISESVDGPGFRRLKLTFASEKLPGGQIDRVPAYLFLPNTAERRPAMLSLHQTARVGKDEPAGITNNTNRQNALDLAQRGYVVLVPDYPGFGEYKYDFDADDYTSGTMKGIYNHLRCVDLLAGRPEVDPQRIGVIGHSLGGHNAMFVGAFDERLKVVVSSCGWTPFEDYMGGKLAGWASPTYMPRLRDVYGLDARRVPFDFQEVVAAFAPRAFFSNSPLHDDNFDADGVRKATAAAQPVYDLLGASGQLQVIYPDCGHDFPPAAREAAYQFIDKVFDHKLAANAEKPVVKSAPGENHAAEEDFESQLKPIPPRDLAAALAAIQVLDGFQVELVAAEPLVASPVAMAFDENGRLFVVEMRDYPESPDARAGRVRVLEDTDEDGRFDKSTTLVDGLSWPTAIACYDGGVFIGAAPDLLYCKDTDGDGRADRREVVFTGFGRTNVQGLMNSLTWGLDNRIHGATSSCGATLRPGGDQAIPPLVLSGRDFAFDPRSGKLLPESGGGQHGLTFDDWGHKFVCSNSDHIQAVMFEDRYVARNPRAQAPSPRVSIALDGPQAEVFRTSPVEPWRILRTRLRVSGAVPGLVEGGGRPAGYFTGATGLTIYRGDAWPAEYHGQALVGDVGSNLAHRKRLTRKEVAWSAKRIDPGQEFLTSSDVWFRPVGFANAPDGTLYVMDMCRETIEHPASLPPQIKKHLDLSSGRERGRILRIVPHGFKQPALPKLGALTTDELVAMLGHTNGWHRDTAARLLYERQDKQAVAGLNKLAATAESPLARLHALYALDGLAALDAALVLRALDDPLANLREHAVRMAEPFIANSEPVRAKLLTMTDDNDPRVRYQLAFTLGELAGASRTRALAQLAMRDPVDPWMRVAIWSSLSDIGGELLRQLVEQGAFANSDPGQQFIEALARQLGGHDFKEAVASAAKVLSGQPDRSRAAKAVLRGFAHSIDDSGRVLLADRLAGPLQQVLEEVRLTAADEARDATERAGAVSLLRLAQLKDIHPLAKQLLAPQQPPAVQLAAIKLLRSYRDPEAAALLVDAWPGLSPQLRSETLETLCSQAKWLPILLTAVESNQIPPREIESARIAFLQSHSDAAIAKRASSLFAQTKREGRQEVIDAYRKSLETPGDAARGKAVFQKQCAACHRAEGVGQELGPNLMAMRNRGAESILIGVLDPNREVNPQYLNYLVSTHDGHTITGIIAGESAASLVLRRGADATDMVLRADIETLRSTGLSLMPEGFEKQIDPAAMADLIGYLMSLK